MVSVNTDGSCKSNPGIAARGGPHSWQQRTMNAWALSPFWYLFIITWRGLGQLIMDGLMLAWNLGSRRLKLEADTQMGTKPMNHRPPLSRMRPTSSSYSRITLARPISINRTISTAPKNLSPNLLDSNRSWNSSLQNLMNRKPRQSFSIVSQIPLGRETVRIVYVGKEVRTDWHGVILSARYSSSAFHPDNLCRTFSIICL